MNGMFDGLTGERMRKALFVALVLVGVFLAVSIIAGIQSLRYIGAGIQPANVISVSGHGEALAVPDLATFSFSVVSTKATVADAQTDATAKANASTKYLTDAGVDKKDIQTSEYSINPQYDYVQGVCTNGYCPGGKQVLRGYEVRQSTTVKVRDTAKAGELLAGVGGTGATEVSGLQLTFDDPNAVQDEARDKAIADAKSKADTLAKQLGVRLVRVTSFSESGSTPMPYYSRAGATSNQALDAKAPAPEISVGQNKTTSDVQITYEIR